MPGAVLPGGERSTRPATLGGAFLSLALVIVAVGVYRNDRREIAALRGADR